MVFTKYAVVNPYQQEGTQEECFNASVLSNALEDDCLIFDTQKEALKNIAENDGLDSRLYIVPLVVDTANICQVKVSISLEPTFK